MLNLIPKTVSSPHPATVLIFKTNNFILYMDFLLKNKFKNFEENLYCDATGRNVMQRLHDPTVGPTGRPIGRSNSDPHAVRLLDLVPSFGFVQSVTDPTHILGNTLDLVITGSDLPHPLVIVDLPQVSDHSLVRFQISIQRPPVQFVDISTPELSTGMMDPRVGSGRVGSRFCRILAGQVGSTLRIFLVFWWLFFGTKIDVNLRIIHSDWLIFYGIWYNNSLINNYNYSIEDYTYWGRVGPRVGPGRVRLYVGNRGSGRVNVSAGRIGSKKSDPGTTLQNAFGRNFDSDLRGGGLCDPGMYEAISIDEVQDLYDTALSSLLDKHTPRRTAKQRYQPLTPWFDSECAASKRKSRMLERRYGLLMIRAPNAGAKIRAPNDRTLWISQVRSTHDLYKRKQNLYWEARIEDSRGNPKNYGEHCPEYLVMIKTTPFHPRTWRLTIFSRHLRRKLRMSALEASLDWI